MDVSLAAKSQCLSLISFPPISSSSCSSFLLSPARFGSLRREFLGCGHNLRPPGLRSSSKCKKLGFQNRSPRFLFRASLDSESALLVVTVVTVSALTVVFLDYSTRKKKKFREVSAPLFLAISQEVKSFMNQFIKNWNLGLDLKQVKSAKESRNAVNEMHENRHEYEDEAVQLQLRETILMPEEMLITNTVESPGSNIIDSSASDSTSSQESEVTGPSFPLSVLSESGAPQPLAYTPEIPKLQVEGHPHGTAFSSDLPALMVKTQSNAATSIVNSAHAEVDEHERPTCELGEAGEIISYGSIFRESGREGLYTFYEANQSAEKSILDLNGLKTLSSDASHQDNNNFSSLMRKCTIDGVRLSAQHLTHAGDNKSVSSEGIDSQIPLACYKEGSPRKSTYLGKSRGFPKEERRIMPQDGHRYSSKLSHPNGMPVNGRRYSPQPSHPKGMHVNDRRYSSQQINVYNRLLKDGRLVDCLELLESMQGKGLLDMDKVYHTAFFKVCQRQRAVKEAFRFVKFIPNPTPSTFNMLMSVCASSQDSEGAFEALQLVQKAGLKPDCKLYTTLISTCAKSGKVDAMFKVFHDMVNAEVEPNVHTYGALIDGCAKAGQVAKAFGAYGIMRSK